MVGFRGIGLRPANPKSRVVVGGVWGFGLRENGRKWAWGVAGLRASSLDSGGQELVRCILQALNPQNPNPQTLNP